MGQLSETEIQGMEKAPKVECPKGVKDYCNAAGRTADGKIVFVGQNPPTEILMGLDAGKMPTKVAHELIDRLDNPTAAAKRMCEYLKQRCKDCMYAAKSDTREESQRLTDVTLLPILK